MNVEQFRNVQRLRPFKPFVIHTSSGESYAVTHPETVWQSPGGHTIIVGIKGATGYVARWDQLDLSNPRRPTLTCAVEDLQRR